MADDHDPDDGGPDDLEQGTDWDALQVMRERAEATRAARDEAVGELRESLSDDEIREHFGIDLREIEG